MWLNVAVVPFNPDKICVNQAYLVKVINLLQADHKGITASVKEM
jgi:hypothetical protein